MIRLDAMTYTNRRDLHNYLQRNFDHITWENKLDILLNISYHPLLIFTTSNTIFIEVLWYEIKWLS